LAEFTHAEKKEIVKQKLETTGTFEDSQVVDSSKQEDSMQQPDEDSVQVEE